MMFSVIKTGGKQYKVAEGSVIEVERLSTQPQESISFSEVLLIAADDSVVLGNPFIDGATVTGTVVEHFKGDKIRVAQFKAKARYRKIHGHRQFLSKVKIEKISFPGKTEAKEQSTEGVVGSKTQKKTVAPRSKKKA